MALIDYTLDEHVAVLTMNSGENRFNFDFLKAFFSVLDEIEFQTEARVLVVKSAHEKIWCNGIDLDWLMPVVLEKPEEARRFPYELTRLLKRILLYPMITIAAVNGHAFAGGAILAAAFDFRFMRSDRGFFCLPEVDLGIPLSPSMIGIMKKAVPMPKFLEMQLTGLRMTAQECADLAIVTRACHLDELMPAVMDFALGLKKERRVLASMKELTFKDIIHMFDKDDPAWFDSGLTGLS